MNIFLSWYLKNSSFKIATNAAKIAVHYQSLAKQKLNNYNYSSEKIGLIYISEKSLINNRYFLQKDSNNICFSVGTPTGINRLFNEYNISNNTENYLFKLKELFDRFGFGLIKKISPPFIFGFIDENHLQIVHDGLGFEQCYIYEDDNCWVCSNKCFPILDFIGKYFTVNDTGWKHYYELGWFPVEHTPFKEISLLGKGEVYNCHNDMISMERIDCLSEWLKPLNDPEGDILEFLRNCFNETVKELIERYCDRQVVSDISGGKDTRMILSSLLNQNTNCVLNLIGENYSTDVKSVDLIKQQYPLDIKHSNPTFMGIAIDQFYTKIKNFIKWQDGIGDFKSCKYFDIIPSDVSLPPKFSGLGGSILKANYSFATLHNSIRNTIKQKLKNLLRKMPGIMYLLKRILSKKSKILHSKLVPIDIRTVARQETEKYELTDCSLNDYVYLTNKFRRWAGANAAVPFSGFLLPHINIGSIKAASALPEERVSQKIHKYVIEYNSEGLDKIPYDTDLALKDKTLIKKPYDENDFWRTKTGRSIVEDVLGKGHYQWTNLLKKNEINNMWKDHCEGKAGHGEFFWRVVGFYFWYEQFNSYFISNSNHQADVVKA